MLGVVRVQGSSSRHYPGNPWPCSRHQQDTVTVTPQSQSVKSWRLNGKNSKEREQAENQMLLIHFQRKTESELFKRGFMGSHNPIRVYKQPFGWIIHYNFGMRSSQEHYDLKWGDVTEKTITGKRWCSGWHALRPIFQAEDVCFGKGKLSGWNLPSLSVVPSRAYARQKFAILPSTHGNSKGEI